MDYHKIREFKTTWDSYFYESLMKATDMQKFVYECDQWDSMLTNSRKVQGAESLTINLIKKMINSVKSKFKNIELVLNTKTFDSFDDLNQSQILNLKTLQEILKNIQLNQDSVNAFSDSLDDCVDRGMSAIFINVVFKEYTLNPVIKLEVIQDMSKVFFDTASTDIYMQNGMYCGILKKSTKEHLSATYGVKCDSDNFFDFWIKEPKPYNFKYTDRGYVREDMITNKDTLDPSQPDRKHKCTTVHYYRYIEGMDKPVEDFRWYSDRLPIIYNPTMSQYKQTDSELKLTSCPHGYECRDIQKMYNFICSQIATSTKTSVLDKWIGTNENVSTKSAINSASNINRVSGFITFDKDGMGQLPTRVTPVPVQAGMIELAQQTKQTILDMTNAFTDTQTAGSVKAMSGVALDKLFKRTDLLQNDIVIRHMNFINMVGRIVKNLIPKIYTYQFDIPTPDGNITINKKTSTGIKNSVKDIEEFISDYEITASIPEELEDQNTIESLIQLYQIYPDAIPLTVDLYVKLCGGRYSDTLSKRISGVVDPILVSYSEGKISKDQMMQYVQQKQQQADQMQQEQMQLQSQGQQMQGEQVQKELQLKEQDQQLKEQKMEQDYQLKSEKQASEIELNQAKIEKAKSDSLLDLHTIETNSDIAQQKQQTAEIKADTEIKKATLGYATKLAGDKKNDKGA